MHGHGYQHPTCWCVSLLSYLLSRLVHFTVSDATGGVIVPLNGEQNEAIQPIALTVVIYTHEQAGVDSYDHVHVRVRFSTSTLPMPMAPLLLSQLYSNQQLSQYLKPHVAVAIHPCLLTCLARPLDHLGSLLQIVCAIIIIWIAEWAYAEVSFGNCIPQCVKTNF